MPIRLDVHPSPEPYFLILPFLSKHVLHSISLKGRTLTKYISKTRYQDLFDRYVGREHSLSCSPKLMRIFTGRPLSSLARAILKMAVPQAMKHSFGFTDFRPITSIVVSCKAGRNGSSSSHELLGNLGKTHLHQSLAKASRNLKEVHDLRQHERRGMQLSCLCTANGLWQARSIFRFGSKSLGSMICILKMLRIQILGDDSAGAESSTTSRHQLLHMLSHIEQQNLEYLRFPS